MIPAALTDLEEHNHGPIRTLVIQNTLQNACIAQEQ